MRPSPSRPARGLVLCINPLVPFDARHASHERHSRQRKLVDGGLPVVLAQTFRAIIHSRMKTGLAKYDIEYKDADVILFEPGRDDADMFFTNMFSYADRKRLSEQAYRKTREELLRRHDELAPKLARHGVSHQPRCPHRSAPLPGAAHGAAEAAPCPEHGAYRAAPFRHARRPGAGGAAHAGEGPVRHEPARLTARGVLSAILGPLPEAGD
jgi:hypothetical protein